MRLLAEWILTSAFLILAVIVLRALLGRRVGAGLRYALWAVVLVRLLVPVQLFSYPVPAAVLPEPDREQIIETAPPGLVSAAPGVTVGTPAIVEPVPGGVVVNHGTIPTTPAPKAEPLPVLQVLGWLWLAGSAAMAAAFIASNLKFARRLRRVRVPLEAADCPLPVYIAQGLPSPCLFGLARPAVYVTPEAADDPVMLRHVLAHEHTHFRHGDHVWNLLRSIALTVHWWNPLVWLAVVLSRRDCELACDEGALKRLGDGERVAYGRTLLALLTVKPRPGDLLTCATTMTSGQKSVFDRVTRIAHAPKRWLWAAVVAVLAAALACVCAFGAAEPETADEPEASSGPVPAASPAPAEPGRTPAAVGEGLDFEFYSVYDGIVRFNDLTWAIASTRSFTFQVEQYAILDLDRDGQTELVLKMEGQGGFYIFRKMDKWLCGFWERPRGMMELKADGTFTGSSGAANWGYYTVSAFTHSGMEHARFTWCESAENHEELYFVDGAPAVQREFEAAVAIQTAKEDAPWQPWVGCPGYPAEAKEWLDAAGVTWLERTWSWGSIRDWDGTLEDWERDKGINYQFSRQDIDSAIAAARPALEEELAGDEWLVSFEITDVYEAHMQTLYNWYMYFESTSALFTDWTKEDMETRYIVIGADYTCEYDHTITLLEDGRQQAAIALTRPAGGEWSVEQLYVGHLGYVLSRSAGGEWSAWDTGDLYWHGSAAPAEEELPPDLARYQAVLLGDADFTLRERPWDGDERERTANVSEVPDTFDSYDAYMKIGEFAVVDLDRDGTDEVLAYVCGTAGDMGGYLVLSQKGGQVYGEVCNAASGWRNRWFQDLKTDGTFQWSSPTGQAGGWGAFNLDTGEVEPILYGEGQYSGDYETFWYNGRSSTEEEYWAFSARQDAKPDAAWYGFTPENIKLVLGWGAAGGTAAPGPVQVDSLPLDGPMQMMLASGAGGWSTDLTLYPDGSFEGDYHDMDMGDSGPGYQSTEYVCQFHGRFGNIQQVTDASWSLILEALVIDTGHPIGEEWIEEKRIEPSRYSPGGDYNQRYISSSPYGMDGRGGEPLEKGARFMFYAPEAKGYAPGDELYGMQESDDYRSIMCQFWSWWPDKHAWGSSDDTLGCYGLCSIETGRGFFDLKAWGIA